MALLVIVGSALPVRFAVAQALPEMLLHVVDDRFPTATTARRTCLTVYRNGEFRFERQRWDGLSQGHTEVFQDVISDVEMEQLANVLNDPEFASLMHPASGAELNRGGEAISVTARRGSTFQHFTLRRKLEPNPAPGGFGPVTQDWNRAAPLLSWMHKTVGTRKLRAKPGPSVCPKLLDQK